MFVLTRNILCRKSLSQLVQLYIVVSATFEAVEPVYKDHPGDQGSVVSVDRWCSYRGVSVYLGLCVG